MSANESVTQAVEQPLQTKSQASWRGRANSEFNKIVQLFSTKELPDLCSKALINSPAKPSSKWSFGNRLLMLLTGTADARGFRQWQEAGRSVSKGAKKSFLIQAQ